MRSTRIECIIQGIFLENLIFVLEKIEKSVLNFSTVFKQMWYKKKFYKFLDGIEPTRLYTIPSWCATIVLYTPTYWAGGVGRILTPKGRLCKYSRGEYLIRYQTRNPPLKGTVKRGKEYRIMYQTQDPSLKGTVKRGKERKPNKVPNTESIIS